MADRPSLLARLEAALTWPRWDDRPAGIVRSDATSGPIGNARHVSDGGAYTLLLRPPPPILDDPRPLAGMRVAVKDLVAVAGCPLRAGSAVRADAPPEPADAAIVARLQGSGAVVVGLTAPHEFAFGVTGVNAHTGTPPNPADPGRIPGGSSSGSAVAVAEGSADLAVGTDTGGSVRIPAAFCGVVGFKPAYGGYPTEGVFPLSPTLDHVGLLATSVDAVRRVHAALGHDPGRGRLPERLGVAEPELEDADVVVAGRIEGVVRVLAAAGLALTRVTWPDQEEVSAVSTAVMYAEAAAVHRRDLDAHADRYGEDVRNRLLTGLQIPAAVYATALRARRGLERRVQAVLSDVDAVVGPTVGMVAPKQAAAGDPRLPGRIVRNTRLANVSRVPAISLPVPGDSLPVGLQLSAGDDARTLGYCAAVQALLQR